MTVAERVCVREYYHVLQKQTGNLYIADICGAT